MKGESARTLREKAVFRKAIKEAVEGDGPMRVYNE